MASSLPPAFGEAFKAIVLRELREEVEASKPFHWPHGLDVRLVQMEQREKSRLRAIQEGDRILSSQRLVAIAGAVGVALALFGRVAFGG